MTLYRSLWCCPYPSHQDGILILDADTGQIMDVNPFLVKMLGYSHAELPGRQLWEIGPFNEELDAFAHPGAHNLKNPIPLMVNYAHSVMPRLDCLSLVWNDKEYLRDDPKRDA